ncbi:hypothetical protein VTP01DRAFT_4908 [Rhizomucor pusillus]|uniref:uncharacterized protein n=1 Tax=Rhizomucor pusillus TaxID=4840 RepID=UPI003743328D
MVCLNVLTAFLAELNGQRRQLAYLLLALIFLLLALRRLWRFFLHLSLTSSSTFNKGHGAGSGSFSLYLRDTVVLLFMAEY